MQIMPGVRQRVYDNANVHAWLMAVALSSKSNRSEKPRVKRASTPSRPGGFARTGTARHASRSAADKLARVERMDGPSRVLPASAGDSRAGREAGNPGTDLHVAPDSWPVTRGLAHLDGTTVAAMRTPAAEDASTRRRAPTPCSD